MFRVKSRTVQPGNSCLRNLVLTWWTQFLRAKWSANSACIIRGASRELPVAGTISMRSKYLIFGISTFILESPISIRTLSSVLQSHVARSDERCIPFAYSTPFWLTYLAKQDSAIGVRCNTRRSLLTSPPSSLSVRSDLDRSCEWPILWTNMGKKVKVRCVESFYKSR